MNLLNFLTATMPPQVPDMIGEQMEQSATFMFLPIILFLLVFGTIITVIIVSVVKANKQNNKKIF